MPSLFGFEDRIDVAIDAPERATEVLDGIRRQLTKDGAVDMRQERDCLRFRGYVPFPWSRSNPLAGIGECEIRFLNGPTAVSIEYRISSSRLFMFWGWGAVLLGIGIAATVNPLALLFLPAVALLEYGCSFLIRHDFRWYLRLAAIRGLADGSEAKLHQLGSQ